MSTEISVHKILCALLFAIFPVHGKPAEYCNQPFNRSDCGMKPKAVFAYWKPGSRCEIRYWRGCPTLNKFDNEVSCSYLCIARIRFESSENEIEDNSVSCEGTLNTDDCRKYPVDVFTYNKEKRTCEPNQWRGCKTTNKFYTEKECIKRCAEQLQENTTKKEDEDLAVETTTKKEDEDLAVKTTTKKDEDLTVETTTKKDEDLTVETTTNSLNTTTDDKVGSNNSSNNESNNTDSKNATQP